jgi:hypothetical protein
MPRGAAQVSLTVPAMYGLLAPVVTEKSVLVAGVDVAADREYASGR